MTPFFAIVVKALGTDDAAWWLEAARKAHRRVVTQSRTGPTTSASPTI